ncbi:ABC transporter permease [Petrocella sp. FN5]|uniref:ABC transporter permease n=1 Tax=Petrocella sp. FN5 TaxID=3032002 RepID=UPI0023DC7794|nr:ABC transporter permease [Petrocella sp. FN5]MDF1615905.1 ABC transporter permease [Petrocella sp. FN5]
MADKRFVFIKDNKEDMEASRPSLTYWQDAWRRLKKNKLAMVGAFTIVMVLLFGIFGPSTTDYSYSDQLNKFKNLPPRLEIFHVEENLNFHLSNDYNIFLVTDKGEVYDRLEPDKNQRDMINKIYIYKYGTEDNFEEVVLDFSYNLLPTKQGYDYDFTIEYDGVVYTQPNDKVFNRTFPFGTDDLGRDILTRVMYGTRISLMIAFIATLVNLLIGVVYGSISGFEGGKIDEFMMRIVDIINSVPLMLYVILLMVTFKENDGLTNIIIALSTVYWVSMARLVRGQMLALKEQEFVLAASVIGVPKYKIIFRHLIPNAMGPIIVSMTMMIPSAVFTEAFLSFIGLGVSAPQASLGTLANNSLSGLLTYPYQLFFPALTIAIIILAFNFLGDGLRDALDPRLRKG